MAGSVIARLLSSQGTYVDLNTNQIVSGTKIFQILQTENIPTNDSDVVNNQHHNLLLNYTSGTNTQLTLVQNHLSEVESYASGTAGTGGGDATAVTSYASGINGQVTNIQNEQTIFNTQIISYTSGIETLRQAMVTGGSGTPTDVQIFTSGTPIWTKPEGAKAVEVIVKAGGGGGAGGWANSAGTTRFGGGAGGGGACNKQIFDANDIAATMTVKVGFGGAGGTSGNVGNAGDESYVSSNGLVICRARGGGAGFVQSASGGSGGGGGGLSLAGQDGNASLALGGGKLCNGAAIGSYMSQLLVGFGGIGGDSSDGINGWPAEWGGGGGGGCTNAAAAAGGGGSLFGGPGGGGGGGTSTSTPRNASDGGTNFWAIGYGGLGATTDGAAGDNGTDGTPSGLCGKGGGGGKGINSGTGGNGGNGGYPSAGGGGGGAGTTGGAGGNGGNGCVVIITYF